MTEHTKIESLDQQALRLINTLNHLNRLEVESYFNHIRQGNYYDAQEILEADLEPDEARIVVDYHKRQSEKSFNLVLASLDEVLAEYEKTFTQENNYKPLDIVFNYKGQLHTGQIAPHSFNNQPIAWYGHEQVDLSSLTQIWLISPI